MPFCKNCGRHVPESEGDVCELCLKNEPENTPYPLILAPPTSTSKKSLSALLIILSIILGVGAFTFFLIRRVIVS